MTSQGRACLLYTYENCNPANKNYYCDMSVLPKGLEGYKGKKDLLRFVKLVDTFDASYHYVANDDTIFTFRTNEDAPRNKLVQVDLKEPMSWTEVLQEDKKDVLESAVAVNGNQIVLNYLGDVKNEVQIRDLETGLLSKSIRFRPSKDGIKIPIFIVARKGTCLDGSHPCLLYGYGGFNISITPYFSISYILIAKHLVVVFCIANIRGRGEYGEEWHKAGVLSRKQNCFDDFISAAEYLVSAGYTQPRKLRYP
ncbi:hypothetical protein Pfo_017101 [Paulownia fortunei]|nr:hypothetical protein Pfo_017101 [Paulownia fortunei]